MDQFDDALDDLENGLIDRIDSTNIVQADQVEHAPASQEASSVRPEDYDEYNSDVTIGFGSSELIDRYKGLPKTDDTTDSYSGKAVSGALFRQGNSIYALKKGYDIGKFSLGRSQTDSSGLAALPDFEDSNFNLKQSLDAAGIPEEQRSFFSSVTNEEEFNSALDYFHQGTIDQQILADTSFARRTIHGLVTGVADPMNWIPVGRMLKYGTPLVKTAIEGAVIGGLNASVRGYVNNNFDVEDVTYESVTSGIMTAAFGGVIKASSYGVSVIAKNETLSRLARDLKNSLSPEFKQWFSFENGEAVLNSSGRFGKFKEKIANRTIWTVFNNSPESQMYHSGDPKLQKLSELLFRNRNGRAPEEYTYINKEGEEITVQKPLVVTAEESMGIFTAKENLMMQRIDECCVKYREDGGELSQFYKEVNDTTINTYVDINTGEFYHGYIPNEEQMNLFDFSEKAKVKNINKYTEEQLKEIDAAVDEDIRYITKKLEKKKESPNEIIDNYEQEMSDKISDSFLKNVSKIINRKSNTKTNAMSETLDVAMAIFSDKRSALLNTIEKKYKISINKISSELNKKIEEIRRRIPKGQREFELYKEDHIENMGLSATFEKVSVSDNPHVVAAAKERLEFWRGIIKKAKNSGVLDKQFGEGGIKVDSNVLTPELANLSAEKFYTSTRTMASPKMNLVSLGHIMRRYNAPMIKSGKSEIRALLYRSIHADNQKLAPNEINTVIDGMMAKLINRDINVRNSAFDDLPSGVSFTKERIIAITDNILSQAGVLDHNVILNELGSWKKLVAESELNVSAIKLGYEKWSDLINDYQVKKNKEIGSVAENGDVITDRMSEAYNYNYALLKDTEKALKGILGKEDIFHNNRVWKFINNSKGLAFISYEGNMPLSFITDGAAVVLRSSMGNALKRLIYGIPNTIATRLSVLLEGVAKPLNWTGKKLNSKFSTSFFKENFEFPTLSNIGKWLREIRTNDPELMQKAFGFIDRQIEETRFMADMDSYTKDGNIQKSIRWVSKYSGLNAINRSLRNVTTQEIYSKLLTECISEKPDMKFLAKMSISEDYRRILANDYKNSGTKNGTVKYLDPHDISDINVETAVRASVETLLNQSTLTPGIGNVPTYLSSAFGKMIYMFATYPYMIYNDIIRPALGGHMADTPYVQAIAASYALSTMRSIMDDMVNDRETDPTSLEFWNKVQAYSWTDFYMIDVFRKASEALLSKRGGEPVDQASPLLGFINTVSDMVKRRKITRGVRNRIPGLNFWWTKPITNPFLPNTNNRGRSALR